MKRTLGYSITILFLILCMWGCDREDQVKEEDDFNFLIAREAEISVPLTPFTSLDPLTTSNLSYFYLSSLVYEGLYTLDDHYRPKELLALETEEEGDKTLVVRLRDGITFHDGSPLQAKDVLFSLQRLQHQKEGPYVAMFMGDRTGEFPLHGEAINNTTIRFTYTGEGPFLKEYLIFPVVSQHSDFVSMPMGTGPFAFDRYYEKKELKLKRYENYHDELPTIVGIRGVVMEDEDLIYTSLETGRVQASTSWGKEYYRFFNNEKYKAKTFSSNKCFFLYLRPEGTLEEKSMREALSKAINKDAIIKDVFFDHGIKTTGFINPNSYLYNLHQDNQNMDRAKQLLGEREGSDIALYYYEKNEEHLLIAAKLKQDWEELGVSVTLKGSGQRSFEEFVDSLGTETYHVALMAMHTNLIGDYPVVLTNGGIFPNIPGELVDYAAALKATTTLEDMKKIHQTLDALIRDVDVFIPLIFTEEAFIYSKSIMGDFRSNNVFPYRDLKTAYFTTSNEEEKEEE
ncbi:MAG: ABC transporter substrate-binding protein [Tissierellia bacterium]|nr:ABC transporter substrate-binding protein [Tissierellia bacterium]